MFPRSWHLSVPGFCWLGSFVIFLCHHGYIREKSGGAASHRAPGTRVEPVSFWWTGRWFRQQPNASRESISEGQDDVWSSIFSNWIVQQMGRQAPPQTAGLWILHMWRSSPKRTRFPEGRFSQASGASGLQALEYLAGIPDPGSQEAPLCGIRPVPPGNHRKHKPQELPKAILTENGWRWAGLMVDSGGEGGSWWRLRKAFPTNTSPLQQQIAYFMPLSKKVKTFGLI